MIRKTTVKLDYQAAIWYFLFNRLHFESKSNEKNAEMWHAVAWKGKRERSTKNWHSEPKVVDYFFFSFNHNHNHNNNSALSSHKAGQWRVFHFHIRSRLNIWCTLCSWLVKISFTLLSLSLFLLYTPHSVTLSLNMRIAHMCVCTLQLLLQLPKSPKQLVDANRLN